MEFKTLISEHSDEYHGFLYPHWEYLGKLVEEQGSGDAFETYTELARAWLKLQGSLLSDDFTLMESSHFLLLSREKDHVQKNLLYACEQSRETILNEFSDSIVIENMGKHVIIVFYESEDYYSYTDGMSGAKNTPLSSGMFIHNGYPHIVIPTVIEEYIPLETIAHEFSHLLLSDYRLPLWLDEAVAMRMEDIVVGSDGLIMNEATYKEHVKFWTESTIQDFWSGELWQVQSSGFSLGYQLARILWKKLAVDLVATKEELVHLMKTVSLDDSGELAVRTIFGCSLGELVADFLGEGLWSPDLGHLKNYSERFDRALGWKNDIEGLVKLERDNLVARPVEALKPSDTLNDLFLKLEVKTISDLEEVSVSGIHQHRLLLGGARSELEFKSMILNLELNYNEVLHKISVLMCILRHGTLSSAVVDRYSCYFVIEIEYLANMFDRNYTYFKLILEGFGGFELVSWDDEIGGEKPYSIEHFASLQAALTGAEVGDGRVLVSTDIGEDEDKLKGADFAFFANAVSIYAPDGKEIDMEELAKVEAEYWDAG